MLALIRRLFSALYKKLGVAGGLNYIGTGESLPPPLSKEEELLLSERLTHGDEAAKTKLIEHNLRLVVYIAKKFDNTGVSIEDLISIGTIGLIKAVNTFRLDKNIKLATYASRCIENEILMHLRKTSRQKLEVSLDEPLNVDWDGNELLLSDVLGSDGDEVDRKLEDDVDRELLYAALSRLSERFLMRGSSISTVSGRFMSASTELTATGFPPPTGRRTLRLISLPKWRM